MKKIIQITLIFFLVLTLIIFYKTYFGNKPNLNTNLSKIERESSEPSKNNLIKNLKYQVKLDQNSQYTITSNLSEITYEDGLEIVKMQEVVALFTDESNIPIIITSDEAIYNNSTYFTSFRKNVKIEYLSNFITSNIVDLDFNNKNIMIKENVKYEGLQGSITSDNVQINLITKKIKMYMNEKNAKVKISTKN